MKYMFLVSLVLFVLKSTGYMVISWGWVLFPIALGAFLHLLTVILLTWMSNKV